MTVRRASVLEIGSIVSLYAAFFREDGISTPEAAIRDNLGKMLEDSRACVFVAEENGALIGLSSGSLTFGVEFGCVAELEDLYVVPAARGRGWASKLASAVLDWAVTEGASDVVLVIASEAERDQALTRFYGKLGFRDSRRITMYRVP